MKCKWATVQLSVNLGWVKIEFPILGGPEMQILELLRIKPSLNHGLTNWQLQLEYDKQLTMASAMEPMPFNSLLILLLISSASVSIESKSEDPTPAAWPPQFHSILFMNTSAGKLQVVDLWYDWPNGRNFNIIQNQLGKLLYDLEWDNGTSFIYTLDSNQECRVMHFPVGVLRPNWLEGANYLGQQEIDGFLCNVWEKVDFIWYYEDVITRRPVSWTFYTGMVTHVMTFEVGAVLEDENWQAPVYCFKEHEKERSTVLESVAGDGSSGGFSLMRATGI